MSQPFASRAPASGSGQKTAKAVYPALTLEATAFNNAQLIVEHDPQVALAGRSNVGKSSLVNALAGRSSLAKISATPGKTRSINYYRVGKEQRFLVDLPGYGYARCSQEERNAWAALLDHYLANTPGLKALILLLDARLPPQIMDQELVVYAASLSLPLVPVLTKTDKCNKKELLATTRAWGKLVDAQSLLCTSARSKTGLDNVWQVLLMHLDTADTPEEATDVPADLTDSGPGSGQEA